MKTTIALWLCLSALACVTFGEIVTFRSTDMVFDHPDGNVLHDTIDEFPLEKETSIKVYNTNNVLEIEVVHDRTVLPGWSYIRPAGSSVCYVTSLLDPQESAYDIVYDPQPPVLPPAGIKAAEMCSGAFEGASATPIGTCPGGTPPGNHFYICEDQSLCYSLCDNW